jgi:DNA helicase-4
VVRAEALACQTFRAEIGPVLRRQIEDASAAMELLMAMAGQRRDVKRHYARRYACLHAEVGSAAWEQHYVEAWSESTRAALVQRLRAVLAHAEDQERRHCAQQQAKHIADQTLAARLALQAAIERHGSARRSALEAFRRALLTDFLQTVDADFALPEDHELGQQLRASRVEFVQQWAAKTLQANLSVQQAMAVSTVGTHALVTARAGSGKTRVLTLRAAFLTKHCGVPASELLILAFNRKAAAEIRERLESFGVDCPHVMTFHALGYAIARPEQGIVCDDPEDGGAQQSSLMQRVVDELLRNPTMEDRVRAVLFAHFRQDWETICESGLALSREDGLRLRRSLDREAIDGTLVKSFGEKVIANFLFEHDIDYGYERNHWWGGRNYRPDFTLHRHKVVIEYFGRVGDAEYDRQCEAKREFWRTKPDWTMLEYSPRQVGKLEGELAQDLRRRGISVVRVSDEELWRRVRDRFVTRFAKLLTSFIGRARKVLWSPNSLEDRIDRHRSVDRIERDVLSIAGVAYRDYLARLDAERREDFDGVLERAAEMVGSGTKSFEHGSGSGDLSMTRFVLVDEFQDLSALFDLLLSAVRRRAGERLQVFGVGDDWQAINGFAGSDLGYFHGFAEQYKPATELAISTNFRSSRAVVSFGNEIMSSVGEPATTADGSPTGSVMVADLEQLSVAASEAHYWKGDAITPAVRRLIRGPLKAGNSIALLARQRYLPYPLSRKGNSAKHSNDLSRLRELVTEGLSEGERSQVAVGTAHEFKGREADCVIVLDAVAGRFPKLHPDWVFGRIFGDTPDSLVEAERRLFYVACSRAKSTLFVMTEARRASLFLDGVAGRLPSVDWHLYPPFCPDEGDWIIRIGNAPGEGPDPTKARAEALKARGFRYERGEWPHWWKRVAGSWKLAWIMDSIPKTSWFDGPDGAEIRVCKSNGAVAVRAVVRSSKLESMRTNA